MAKSTYSTYNNYKKKAKKNRGLHKQSYSDFWLNDRYDYLAKYEKETEDQSLALYTKAVKLYGYQRAIGNFVKIVTNKDIPVKFAGSTSYTNGNSVTISADIKDNNFDVSVGLALHEASHIILSDMVKWTEYLDTFSESHSQTEYSFFKSLTNWLEDRRIDNTIFKQSPGYKAYYHKLYDYYWNDDVINKALLSDEYRDPRNYQDWLFNIINSMSPFFNVNRMTGLKEVMDILDVQNITRLTTTNEVIKVVEEAFKVVQSHVSTALQTEEEAEKQKAQTAEVDSPTGQGNNDNDTEYTVNVDDTDTDETETDDESDTQSFNPSEQLDVTDRVKIYNALRKQVDLINNAVQKKNITNDLAEPLNAFDGQGGKLVQLEDAFIRTGKKGSAGKKHNAPGYFTDLTKSPTYNAYVDLLQREYMNEGVLADKDKWAKRSRVCNELRKINNNLTTFLSFSDNKDYLKAIHEGLTIGGLIANKLRTHGESRDRIDNRQLTGTLDKRRIAHLGYGVESVFQRINIQRNKPAHIHLTIDGSGSMQDEKKWTSTIKLAVGIARGIQGKPHLSMSVSVRVNASELYKSSNKTLTSAPAIAILWDSRTGTNPTALGVLLSNISFSSSTPEGLCYDILAKSGYLTPGSTMSDNYLINISDGCPNWNSRYHTTFDNSASYNRSKEYMYTNKWWKKLLTKYNMIGLSYFIHSTDYLSSRVKADFEYMYGKDSTTINASNAMEISTTLNKMLLANTCNVLV